MRVRAMMQRKCSSHVFLMPGVVGANVGGDEQLVSSRVRQSRSRCWRRGQRSTAKSKPSRDDKPRFDHGGNQTSDLPKSRWRRSEISALEYQGFLAD